MSDESGVAQEKIDEGVTASAPVAPQPVGPAVQSPEEKKKEEEAMRMAEPPKENKWASGAFKRGVVLQVRYRP